MFTVSVEFAVYFYVITTLALTFVFWFYWHTKDLATSDDFKHKGRQPMKQCELCQATYIDNSNGPYSTCPKCEHLTEK